jgi:hypothetical protein
MTALPPFWDVLEAISLQRFEYIVRRNYRELLHAVTSIIDVNLQGDVSAFSTSAMSPNAFALSR